MKVVKLTIGQKTYEKKEPMLKDWFDNIDIAPKLEKGLADRAASEAYVKVVADYLMIDEKEVLKANLKGIVEAYKAINESMVACFGGKESDKSSAEKK
jgi:hypothetical protein